MNVEQIKELIRIVETSAITSFEMEESGYRIRIGKEETARQSGALFSDARRAAKKVCSGSKPMDCSSDDSCAEPDTVSNSGSASSSGASSITGSDLIDIKSPMLGVFYSSPSPDEAPFVKTGDRVKKGDVLCIIEAMKLMNEILAEKDGEIADICTNNGQIVEFAQTLFTLRQ